MEGPLNGVRVLDVGTVTVGPGAASNLGLLGADVIRIEPPYGDMSMYVGTSVGGIGNVYTNSNFNKRNIALDLTTEEGRQILLRLVKTADVFIENRRVGAMARMGLAYEELHKVNPRIIYISCSAYGQTGPWKDLGGLDHFIQAASGFASLNGADGGPPQILRYVAHVDFVGSIMILQAALLGLLARRTTGEGQKIDVSSFEGAIALQASRMAEFFATKEAPPRLGSATATVVPSQSFKTLDNRYINVSVPKEEFWPKLCRALGLEQLQADSKFRTNADRVKNREELVAILAEKFADKAARWWLIHLQRHDVPCGLNYTYEDVCSDPHIQANKMIVDAETAWGFLRWGNAPWKFSRTPVRPLEGTPYPDAHRDEILKSIGYYEEQR